MPDEAYRFRDSRAAVERVLAKELFFIGGQPKSGTTWLQLLLDAHPDISCRGEGHFADQLAPPLREMLQLHSASLETKNKHVFAGMAPFPTFTEAHYTYLLVSAVALLLDAACDPAAAVIGEKTPDNARYYGQLAALFPRAKFVHIVRDARDCAVSAWFHNLRTNPEGVRAQFGTLAKFLPQYAQKWGAATALAASFGAAHPARFCQLRYEDLVAAPRATLTRLLEFLGVAASARVADACVAAAGFETLSGGRAPGEEDRASFFRRGEPGDWRRHLSEADNHAFLATCGAAMALYGYA